MLTSSNHKLSPKGSVAPKLNLLAKNKNIFFELLLTIKEAWLATAAVQTALLLKPIFILHIQPNYLRLELHTQIICMPNKSCNFSHSPCNVVM